MTRLRKAHTSEAVRGLKIRANHQGQVCSCTDSDQKLSGGANALQRARLNAILHAPPTKASAPLKQSHSTAQKMTGFYPIFLKHMKKDFVGNTKTIRDVNYVTYRYNNKQVVLFKEQNDFTQASYSADAHCRVHGSPTLVI